MFSSKERITDAETEQYLQRIAELEAELDAARRLIVDQQQMLKSNLSASILPDSNHGDEEAWASGESMRMAPLRVSAGAHSLQNAPIKLPDFGVPVVDIADKVIRAASEKSVAGTGSQKPAQNTVSAPSSHQAHFSEAGGNTQDARPGSAEIRQAYRGRTNLFHPLLVCSAILAGSALAVLTWTQYQNSLAKHARSIPINRTSTTTQQIPPAHGEVKMKSIPNPR